MSIPYLAQPEQQQKLEWLDGSTFSVLLDAATTGGQLTVGRFFMLIKGTAQLWVGEQEPELPEGGIVYPPR